MSIAANLPVLIMQLPHVQQMAHGEHGHPEMQQVLAQQIAKEQLKEETKQVPVTDPSQSPNSVDKDGGGQAKQHARPQDRRDHAPAEPVPTEPHTDSPWAGNIIDQKI